MGDQKRDVVLEARLDVSLTRHVPVDGHCFAGVVRCVGGRECTVVDARVLGRPYGDQQLLSVNKVGEHGGMAASASFLSFFFFSSTITHSAHGQLRGNEGGRTFDTFDLLRLGR